MLQKIEMGVKEGRRRRGETVRNVMLAWARVTSRRCIYWKDAKISHS